MGELQCTLEFSVELHKFINIDLFQRGFYQVRSLLKTSPKFPVKIGVNLPKNSSCSLVFPACIVNGVAVSKTFQILYKNEEVILDDIIIFKVHMLLEGHRVKECLLKADFQIIVELWFTEQSFGPDQHNSIHCVSARSLILHFDPDKGLHHHIPLLFDYFHLCAVTITIHASLIAVCQPYFNLQKPSKQNAPASSPRLTTKKSHSSMETVFFGLQVGRTCPSTTRLYRAHLIHWELCSILLSAHNCLCRKLLEYMTLLPPWQQLKLDSLENFSNFENLSDFAKECNNHVKSGLAPSKEQFFGLNEEMFKEEDFLIKANSDITLICDVLIVLWQKFLEIVIGREKIRQYLSRQRHFQRVKRFSEAFFIIERNRDSALAPCDSSVETYQDVSDCLRKSSYLNLLPPLEVECVEFDGDLNSLPIVFEEHYQETARRGSETSQCSQFDSTTSLTDISLLVEESTDKNIDGSRRTSQGSLGQKYRSPDISATPTSPSAYSWCPELVTAPFSVKNNFTPSKKQSIKEKIFHNFKNKSENEYDELLSVSNPFTRINQKIAVRSKMKLRSRTVNFLKQLKKPQDQTSVMLLGVKKLESLCNTGCSIAKSSRIQFPLEKSMRHSQSTLSVMSTLYATGITAIPNSESMPDLTTTYTPPLLPSSQYFQKENSSNGNSEPFLTDEKHESLKVPSPKYHTPKRRNSLDKTLLRHSTKNHSSLKADGTLKSMTIENIVENESDHSKDQEENFNVMTYSKKQSHKNSELVVSSQPSKRRDNGLFIKKESKNKFTYPLPLPIIDSQDVEETTISNLGAVCPPSPPIQFKDPSIFNKQNNSSSEKNQKLKPKFIVETDTKSSSSQFSDNCMTSLLCQGTIFFPKPPAQFGDDVVDHPAKENETLSLSEDSEKFKISSKSIQHVKKKGSDLTSENLEYLSSNNIKNVEQNDSVLDTKCTIFEMLSVVSEPDAFVISDNVPLSSEATPERQRSLSLSTTVFSDEEASSIRRASVIGTEMICFVKAKEEFRKHLHHPWLWYSDFPSLASDVPYFQYDSDLRAFNPESMHLVICVHGLDGNSADLRLVKTYLELGLPRVNFEFLMSERNQGETFDDFDTMTDRLVSEISYYIDVYGLKPVKISFIGHSLGNIIIRSALTRPEMKPYLSKLHTFLSLSGPHLGTLYNSSGLVNMGMWFMQKWKKSGSLLQLSMKDASDLRQTFLYKLSKKSGLEHFRNILLFGSSQDRYVPLHSARIELCKNALKDTSYQGIVYREMITNIIQPIIQNPNIALYRYDVHHALPSSANSLIGRAAHIAVLDSELFIEKFLVVCGLRFFT